MKLFTLCLASAVWAGIACLIDRWTHNFGFAFLGGAIAAVFVVCVIEQIQVAAVADRLERAELRRIAEEEGEKHDS